jgi:hypothetical protein
MVRWAASDLDRAGLAGAANTHSTARGKLAMSAPRLDNDLRWCEDRPWIVVVRSLFQRCSDSVGGKNSRPKFLGSRRSAPNKFNRSRRHKIPRRNTGRGTGQHAQPGKRGDAWGLIRGRQSDARTQFEPWLAVCNLADFMESFLPVSKPLGALENAASRTRTLLSGHRTSRRPACAVGDGPSPRRPLAYRVQDGRPAELPRRG